MKQKIILKIIMISFLLSGCGDSGDNTSNGNNVSILEQGHINGSWGYDPVDIVGDLFAYDISSSCTYSVLKGFDYIIYSDGSVKTTSYDDGIQDSCSITEKYGYVNLTNTVDVNASYIDSFYFYDDSTGIHYYSEQQVSGYTSVVLSEITNGGLTGVFKDDTNQTIGTKAIDYAYKKL